MANETEERLRTALYDVMTLLKEQANKEYIKFSQKYIYDKAKDICHDNELDPITAQDK